jgi:hypothetical protein
MCHGGCGRAALPNDNARRNTMPRKCLACGKRPAATTPEWPALCNSCLNRSGQGIKPGIRVVCEVDDACSGTVDRIEDGLAVVCSDAGKEAWVPIQELIPVR